MVCAHSLEGSHLVWGDPHEVDVWFGSGQGLCRTPGLTVSSRLCADTTGLGESWLSGLKACRTVDRPVPRGGTQGRKMPPCLCVWRARGQGGRVCMLVAHAGHDGSHGCAAPGPSRWRWCCYGVSRPPCSGSVRLRSRLVEGGAHQVQSGCASRWCTPHIGVKDRQRAGFPAPMVRLDDVLVVG